MTQAHRKPPLPVRQGVPRGTCRWCGKPVNEPRRYFWHKACLDEYEGILDELAQPHSALWERQGGRCAICGLPLWAMSTVRNRWDHRWHGRPYQTKLPKRKKWRVVDVGWNDDHIIPLVDALPHADDPLWAWRLSNRQAVCIGCHKAKTAAEATRRAVWRKQYQDKQLALPLEVACSS
jgi:5-methylcytosine-specific restriction endonuclease McrA